MKTDNLPKVTVITLYYNRPNNTFESIKSLIDQTYENLEIVIVDDCSTDETYNNLLEVAKLSNRVTLKRNSTNKGFTQSLIDTIKELDSPYIAIHGAGDISLPTRIEVQVNYLEENKDVGVVCVDILNIKNPKFYKTEITLKDLLQKNRITHGAVMYRKSVYDEVDGYRNFFTTRQDKDLWFRMSLVTKIHFISVKLYELINIKSSVSNDSAKSVGPTLMSVFAEFLIKERIKLKNKDSLQIKGAEAALMFNPSNANLLFIKLMLWDLYQFKFNNVFKYLKILICNNKTCLILILILILMLIFKL